MPGLRLPIDSDATPARRRFLARVVKTLQAAMAATVGVITGGAIASPGFARRQEHWLPAVSLGALPDGTPTAVALRVAREDGYGQIVERRTVFLVKTGEADVTALDSTCTHLGCRVTWDAVAKELRCPCHGGAYDHLGAVKAGPPPGPLQRLATKIDGGRILIRV
jgi:Rieske Fe-S protein